MDILIACEYSGRVRRAFAALGHNVISADFEPAEDGSPNHYQCDCFDLIGKRHFDMLIAHPDCTYLTIAAEWCYNDVQTKKLDPNKLYGVARRRAREKALEFVDRLWAAPIHFICLENPVGVISTMRPLMPAPQYIQPYDFGEDASKKTGLWLKNLPRLRPTKYIEPRIVNGRKRWANQTDSGQNRLPPSDDRWKERSRTYLGIADAFAQQWGFLQPPTSTARPRRQR